MPEPRPQPEFPVVRRTAWIALIAGAGITAIKFGVYFTTGSVAVLGDAFESIVNVVAAGLMVFSVSLANRPADATHRYGHGKVESLAVGVEGGMILLAGIIVGFQAIMRLIGPQPMPRLDLGIGLVGIISVLTAGLAWYVWRTGRRHGNAVLIADGKHLMTDFGTTLAVLGALVLVKLTGLIWLDPVVALVMAAVILRTSWNLLREATDGLMDRADPADDAAIRGVLEPKITSGLIHGYHKLRHRHSGAFHWVDVHVQVDGLLTVRKSHELASNIEHEIERLLGQGNVTVHIEPPEAAADARPAPGPASDSTTPPPPAVNGP